MDPRYSKLKSGLEQLTSEQLQVILDTPESKIICDRYLYHEGRT